ncbi:MAG: glycyl-radical enzyme activating protein [Clostridium sp.]|nr:glycyl-radical enzyme activating protein [Clostridium sp.]
MAELICFDLQRFALHDGPGIRTTVFLKGCPLDCVWCHNPESKRCGTQLGFIEKKCTKCGKCQEVCTHSVHRVDPIRHEIDFARCVQCGLCTDACFNHALKFYGKKASGEEILEIVMKDMDFYRKSNGGLTVSGGEPMVQFEPLLELLKKAKKNGLHVCVDTSGQASRDKYREIADYTDLFLFDYKITDTREHKRYTGADNRLILSNLDYLCKSGSRVILRCPIIPGINDNKRHYQGITELSHKYKGIEAVNLMMYHDMAKGKAAQIGEVYALQEIRTIEAEDKKRIYSEVEACGCLKLREN